LVQIHSPDLIILKGCRYALVFPCVVTNAVKFYSFFDIGEIFLGYQSFGCGVSVLLPFYYWVSDSCRTISLFGILL
jgi:hypothetical protein